MSKEFGRIKAGYGPKRKKPENGDILIDGKVFIANKPFALLQTLKKEIIQRVGKNRVTVKYTTTK